jgi:glycosyltransferase involved in cell wall biosynthesis
VDGELRILQVMAPASYGGLESVVSLLASGLATRGHRVRVAATLSPGDPEPAFLGVLADQGVQVTPLRVGRRDYRGEARRLAALCAELDPQLIHTHGERSDWVGGGLARRRGIPHFATVHGFILRGWKSRLTAWLQLRSLRRFDGVIAVSTPLADALLAAGVPGERVHRLPNAWAPRVPRLSREEARRALGLPERGSVVGFVGRLGREKGPDVLLEALALLGEEASGGAGPAGKGPAPDEPDGTLHLCLVGDGPESEALRALAERRGVAERLHAAGAVSGAERLFAAFDVFALSSRSEGTPMVLFEAMAAGVPIVAARVGGVPDVIGAAEALLVAPEDPGALAAAIRASLAEPAAAAARAARARLRLEAEFAQAPWLDRHETLYRAALAARSPSAAGSGSSASAASLTVAGTTSAKRDTPST